MIVWDKGGGGLGANYSNAYELIGFFHNSPTQKALGQKKSGARPVHQANILRFNRVTGPERQHNAAKPVGLISEILMNSSEKGEIVADYFTGSGSTLIACEKTGRIFYGMEIGPKYCDITVSRWCNFTGKDEVKINGKTVSWVDHRVQKAA